MRLALALALSLLATPAFAVDPEDRAASLAPSRAAIEAEDWARAMFLLGAIVRQEPENAEALNLLGYASRKVGALEEAAEHYEAALAADPEHLGALEYQGELFVLLGDLEAACANLQRLTELCGNCEEREELAAVLAAGG
jgi:Flp pilus assembly protein TadD